MNKNSDSIYTEKRKLKSYQKFYTKNRDSHHDTNYTRDKNNTNIKYYLHQKTGIIFQKLKH